MTGKKKPGTTGTGEDGGSDRREVKHRYMGDGQNEEEGKPSLRGSPWAHPVIGWDPEDGRDAGHGHGSLRFLAAQTFPLRGCLLYANRSLHTEPCSQGPCTSAHAQPALLAVKAVRLDLLRTLR